MYKLLLVTDREEVRDVFLRITEWKNMHFHPITILSDVTQAIEYLETNPVDAVGYSVCFSDVAPLHQYLVERRPSLPIFQTHQHDETLRTELKRIRCFLDRMHMDYSDEDYDEEAVLQYLRDELVHQLLAGEVKSAEELKSRLKLVRVEIVFTAPCFVFDFDMPQGEVYLSDRWRYGRERLANALRTNFFGRFIEGIYYGVAVLTPRHIRLIAFQRCSAQDADTEKVLQQVLQRVRTVVNDIKQYLDLDLDLQEYKVLPNIYSLTEDQTI